MAKRALIIGAEEQANIAKLIAKATASPMPLARVVALHEEREAGRVYVDENLEYTMHLPIGHIITYTHEEQKRCVCRHLSISLMVLDKNNQPQTTASLPDPMAADVILEAFGFHNRIRSAAVWLDKEPNHSIVNVVEPLDGNMDIIRAREKESEQ